MSRHYSSSSNDWTGVLFILLLLIGFPTILFIISFITLYIESLKQKTRDRAARASQASIIDIRLIEEEVLYPRKKVDFFIKYFEKKKNCRLCNRGTVSEINTLIGRFTKCSNRSCSFLQKID